MGMDYKSLENAISQIIDKGYIQRVESLKEANYDLVKFDIRNQHSREGQLLRIDTLESITKTTFPTYRDNGDIKDLSVLKGNIENFIGFSKVPTGLVGPLLVHGTEAAGSYYLPLATTEGALVASYNRGAKAISQAGGVTSVCISERVQRSPLFKFKSIVEIGKFIAWVMPAYDQFTKITSKVSRYGKLTNMKTNIEGNQVNLVFEFTTGDAAGQNMVTFCTNAICNYILDNCLIKPQRWYIESNFSGDKKANYQSLQSVRGKKVIAEVILPRSVVESTLRSTPEEMVDYWITSTLSSIQIGSIGTQGHIANGLTALFIATGQDVACISEISVAINRFEVTEDGGLYASLTMPNLIVGSVGGGTSLPSQSEALRMMNCSGEGNGQKFAEVCCALALAGELSIAAAIASDHFVSAHKKLGR